MLAVKHVDAQGRLGRHAKLGSESAAVDATLATWRRKADDILMTATAVVRSFYSFLRYSHPPLDF